MGAVVLQWSFYDGPGLAYFPCIRFVDCVLGNSSSGIIEVPSFKKGTINIGSRQDGRLKAKSVIDCDALSQSIINAIERLYSINFQNSLKNVNNPYGEEGALEKIFEIISNFEKPESIQKQFFDLDKII